MSGNKAFMFCEFLPSSMFPEAFIRDLEGVRQGLCENDPEWEPVIRMLGYDGDLSDSEAYDSWYDEKRLYAANFEVWRAQNGRFAIQPSGGSGCGNMNGFAQIFSALMKRRGVKGVFAVRAIAWPDFNNYNEPVMVPGETGGIVYGISASGIRRISMDDMADMLSKKPAKRNSPKP